MVFWISLKFLTLYREIRTTRSINVFFVGRQYKNFHLTNIFQWVCFYEKISYQWNDRKPSKKESVSKKSKNTQRNIKKNLNTTNFVSSIFLCSSFLLPWKFVEGTYFLKQCNSFGDLSPREDYFPPSLIELPLNTKIFVKASGNRKNFEILFEKIVLLFNTGNGKYDCNNKI